MRRRLFGATALICFFVAFAAPVAESDPSRSAPMQFQIREDQSPRCGAKCKAWVSATGMIRADTARDFEIFAARNDIRGMMLVLNSEGGSVHGAIALGRVIRRYDMTTTIGRTIDGSGSQTGLRKAGLSPRADCESMCAFVLLAGTRRIVPPEARVRVHQIWLGDRRDDAAAAVYSAEDLVLVQRDIGKLAQYTVEMGGSVELLEVSLRIPPWEPMRSLTRDELRRMKLDNSDVADALGTMPGTTTDATSPVSHPLKRISLRSQTDRERGWVMAEQDTGVTLTRRHPLTIEGENFGILDVTFACGKAPNEVLLLYTETRRALGGEDVAPLQSVEIRLANKIFPLTLGVTRPGAQPGERLSSASASLPISAIRSFAAAGSRSLTVETRNDAEGSAVIRIGNTGASQNLSQFASACTGVGRSEHAVLKPAP